MKYAKHRAQGDIFKWIVFFPTNSQNTQIIYFRNAAKFDIAEVGVDVFFLHFCLKSDLINQ